MISSKHFLHVSTSRPNALLRSLVIGTTLLCGANNANASPTTITAASCEFADVASAASTAAAAGAEILAIPAGTCDWHGNQLVVNAGIEIRGAGVHATILERTEWDSKEAMIQMQCYSGGKQALFSGITLKGHLNSTDRHKGLQLAGGCVDFIVRHSRFEGFVAAGVEVIGPSRQRGVIYGNEFVNNYNPTLHNLGYGVVLNALGAWTDVALGTADAVYVENNYMYGNRHHIASNNGAKYVFRHNTAVANMQTRNFPQLDAHGLGNGSKTGTRSWEIYNNDFQTDFPPGSGFANDAIGIRGGAGVIFGNTYGKNIAAHVKLLTEAYYNAQMSCSTTVVSPAPQDQVQDAYIWETNPAKIANPCSKQIVAGTHFFLTPRPDYTPYTYPHPLRPQ
ncbi:hypothetical protein IV454_30035 [Massilia antarctica]|uniref:Right-handed parallel beta-helix repeat-containing protein n=1 Tax=Massilia antarctica TaxID=2765360 RepID=A0AA48WC10_9BURK|nr:hypothetical protein [Massilia antarctica]QPI49617.1 hypothetical protein IV454_30035 [Massilia antarctica]